MSVSTMKKEKNGKQMIGLLKNESNPHCYIFHIKKLQDRAKQHRAAVRNSTQLSLIFQHVPEHNHTMDFEASKVLSKCTNEKPRKLIESF